MKYVQMTKYISFKSAETAATFLWENGITVILSWVDGDGMFSDKRIALCIAVPETALAALDRQTYFKNN